MDWLLERQERIERTLAAATSATGEGFMLYDLSSSYVEGRCCPLASLGYSRDGKRRQGAGQLRADLLARGPPGRDRGARRIDTKTSRPCRARSRRSASASGSSDVVVVGDRGMLTEAHAEALTEAGVDFVSALKSAQIRALVEAGDLQLSLFDETNLAEICSR